MSAIPSQSETFDPADAAFESVEVENHDTLEPETGTGYGKYCDAAIITPYRDTDYEFPIKASFGSDSKSMKWKTRGMPAAQFIAELLCRHREGPKDGLAFVLADMVDGQRLKNAVRACTGVGLDIDDGTPTALIDEAIKRTGYLAVRYSTHSHLKETSVIKRDEVIRFAKIVCNLADANDSDINTALVQRYLKEKKQAPWYGQHADTVVFKEIVHEKTGLMVKVSHAPMHKNRIIFFLKKPYDMSKEAQTHQEAMRNFGLIPAALAEMLGISFDKACTDPCRHFYLPRHEKGRQYSISLFGGELLDHTTLDCLKQSSLDKLAAEFKNKGGGSSTDAGKALAKWAYDNAGGYQITDVIQDHCSGRLRGKASSWGYTVECPYDDSHSNAGDPDDTGCYAVNAHEGTNERFVFRCQHDSCKERSNLDMLGRLIELDEIPRAALDDPQYNIVQKDGDGAENADTDAKSEGGSQGSQSGKGSDKKSNEAISDGYGGALVFRKIKGPIPKGVSFDKDPLRIHNTYRNALVLIGSEKLDLGYNELTQNFGMRGEVAYPWPESLGYALSDAILREIRLYLLSRWGVTFKQDDIYEACVTLARRNTFNPVCDYLDDVESEWDGVSRADTWLEVYMGVQVAKDCRHPPAMNEKCPKCDHRDYVRAVGKIVLVAAARRAREPGCKFDEMLILEGRQGGGKSTAVGILGGEWYSDAKLGKLEDTQKVGMKLRGTWIHEFAELVGLTRDEVDEVKDFLSKRSDRYRQPYGRTEDDYFRRCFFIGTVNPGGSAYLVDLTGNRRFWPVACGTINLETLERDRDQLWAEAAMMESRGDAIRLPESLYEAARTEQESRLAFDPWVERLAVYLEGLNPAVGRRVLSNDLLDALGVPVDRQAQPAFKKLKNAMSLISTWEYKPSVRAGGVKSAGYEYVGEPKTDVKAEASE